MCDVASAYKKQEMNPMNLNDTRNAIVQYGLPVNDVPEVWGRFRLIREKSNNEYPGLLAERQRLLRETLDGDAGVLNWLKTLILHGGGQSQAALIPQNFSPAQCKIVQNLHIEKLVEMKGEKYYVEGDGYPLQAIFLA